MSVTPRVFYFCPDFPQPSGGVRSIYRHVAVLHAAGVDAAVVQQNRGFVADWHGYRAPVIWLEDRPRFQPTDTLVFPEVMAAMVRQTAGFSGRRLVFALSWLPSYANLSPGERWRDLGVDGVLVQSPTVARAVAWSEGRPAHYIPPFVDPALYHADPAVDPASRRAVAYLTRKDRAGAWLHGHLEAAAAAAGLTWTALRNLPEADYAAALRGAALYVPTTVQEGLHVSVLEAMACGALVVGFAAVGGNDYLVGEGPAQNCILVDNGDLPALGQTVAEVLATLADDPAAYSALTANAQRAVQPYQDPKPQRDALLALFSHG